MDGHALNDDPAPGWYRELVARRSEDKVDAYYYPPDGTQLRSRPDVRRYFEAHPDAAKVGDRTLDPQSDFQYTFYTHNSCVYTHYPCVLAWIRLS